MSNQTAATKIPISPTVQTAENGKEGLPHPVLISAKELAAMLGCSEAHVWRLHSCAGLPMPLKMGRLSRWRVAEVREWLEAGAPPRERWAAMKRAAKIPKWG